MQIIFQIWEDLHGAHRVTNYIHMIGSGYMYDYMVRRGNLKKYPQQGWEALKSLIKLFFFQRTNKDGNNIGIKAKKKSKLLPIAKLLQRRFFWICNLVPETLWDDNFVMPSKNN